MDIPKTAPHGGVESLLDEARRRTLALVEPVSEADLDRQHDPLMSPLVWDLGHIAAFEDLWVCRETGLELLRPDLAEVYDATETPRPKRADLPYLRRDEAIDYMEAVRERTLASLDDVPPFIWEMLLQHEHQHNETMLQTLQLAEPGVYAPERTPRSGRGGLGERRWSRRGRWRSASRATASPTTTSGRAIEWSWARTGSTARR